MLLLEVLVAVLLALPCVLWLLRHQQLRANYGQAMAIPLLPEPCTFFGGHVSWLSKELKKSAGLRFLPFYEAFKKHKLPIYNVRIGPPFQIGPVGRVICMVNDSTLAEEIAKSKDFGRSEDIGELLSELLGGISVLSMDGAKWKRHRRLMQPMFRKEQLAYSLEIIHRQTSNYLEELQKAVSTHHPNHASASASRQKPVDLVDTIQFLAMDVSAEVGFSYNLRSQSEEKRTAFRKSMAAFVLQFTISLLQQSMTLYRILHRKEYQEFINHREFLKDELIYKIIKERKDAMDRGEATPEDLLSFMLNANYSKSEELTEEEVINNAFAVFGAGYDTTSASLLWLLYYIAKYPEVQERIYSEVTHVASEVDLAGLEGIGRLTYLSRVLNEVQRLEPVSGFYGRGALRDTVVQGYHFPAGGNVHINVYSLHHSPDEWDEPEEFKPDRWEKPDGGCKKHSVFAYAPFGAGDRRCIGQPLALLQLKLTGALFVNKFKLTLADGDCKREMPFIYKPGQVIVNLEPR